MRTSVRIAGCLSFERLESYRKMAVDSPARHSRAKHDHFCVGLCMTPKFTANSDGFPQISVNAAAFAWRAQRSVRAFGSRRAGGQMEPLRIFRETFDEDPIPG